MLAALGVTIRVATTLPRTSIVESAGLSTQSTAPLTSALAAPSGMKSRNSCASVPLNEAVVDTVETRVRIMLNH